MDFQKFVDGFHSMTCVVSVEKLPDGKWGEIRLVAGNKAYIDSIENIPDAPKMLTNKFIPNSLYQNYIPKDTNFELFCYSSAVLKKPMHSYVHPERFDFWFNLFSLPIDYEDGNLCYCTYTQELTHEAESSKMSNVSQGTAAEVLNTCIKLRGNSDFKETMKDVIKDIREICGAAYCGILNIDGLSNKCSMLGEDISSDFVDYNPGWFTEDFYEIVRTWDDIIGGSNCFIFENEQDMEYIKEKNPLWYDSLVKAHVQSLVLFPLKSGFELLGYIWATNFDTDKTLHIKETLELTTYFIASEISSYQMFDKFKILSTVDLLTGVLNRNEMNNRVMQLSIDNRPGRENIGIVFADLNGLKQMNDNEGHSAGDKLIKDAAKILKHIFPDKEIYRAGGDEFMVLLRGTSMSELEDYSRQMKAVAEETETVSFAIGLCVEEDSQSIYDAMRKADINMYEDKKAFYEAHPERKRR
ncbi:diguanylate cyclase (GGDEF) domain-containing protein [Treponema bryantii]|uniref:diguanylate cyclase n=1 Tax=Treponema bryantii TaxID=163 RepID=A0A1H9JW72_9SPIR|nr:GGDEF domain-containing protein [Treponema bryantii]SEQ91047.1 diguanylate cyclase (GGDEF) domain-containing protein [Treponema bryantii]